MTSCSASTPAIVFFVLWFLTVVFAAIAARPRDLSLAGFHGLVPPGSVTRTPPESGRFFLPDVPDVPPTALCIAASAPSVAPFRPVLFFCDGVNAWMPDIRRRRLCKAGSIFLVTPPRTFNRFSAIDSRMSESSQPQIQPCSSPQ